MFNTAANGIKPSKLYSCPHCEANFYGRNLDKGKIPNHRWLGERCGGSQQEPAK